jgi:hypothetical protein
MFTINKIRTVNRGHDNEYDVKKYVFPSHTYSFAVEKFVIAVVPRTCWIVQNHKIGASDVEQI